MGGAYGDALVVRVAARAVEGAATEAALAAVARDVALVTGATSRDKVVEVSGVEEGVLAAAVDRLRSVT